MKLSGEITLASGFIFDYSNMLNTHTITAEAIEALESKAADAADALMLIREQGTAKAPFCGQIVGRRVLVYFIEMQA